MDLAPPSPYSLLQRGSLLLLVGRPSAALDDLNAALTLRPGWPLALYYRAFVYKELQLFLPAAEDFEEAKRADATMGVDYNRVFTETLPEDAYDREPEWQVGGCGWEEAVVESLAGGKRLVWGGGGCIDNVMWCFVSCP